MTNREGGEHPHLLRAPHTQQARLYNEAPPRSQSDPPSPHFLSAQVPSCGLSQGANEQRESSSGLKQEAEGMRKKGDAGLPRGGGDGGRRAACWTPRRLVACASRVGGTGGSEGGSCRLTGTEDRSGQLGPPSCFFLGPEGRTDCLEGSCSFLGTERPWPSGCPRVRR